jgi:hypothetical protein
MLLSSTVNADEAKELKTEKGKAIVLGNMAGRPASCSSNPGPMPIPQLRQKPSHGAIFLQTAEGNLAATDSCPARKIPGLVLIYMPNPDFVGVDTVQIEFEAGANKLPTLNLRITISDPEKK